MKVIRNRYSKKEYHVTDAEWGEMVNRKNDKLFEVVKTIEDRPMRTPVLKQDIKIPATIERVKKGSDAPEASQKHGA